MPQLNPVPWFSTLVLSWAIFLIIVPPKVLAHAFPNKPSPKGTKGALMTDWNWPWQ
uniref:ATP synthase complex subunit 8 n=1 Tax=Uranoscopus tosae TaxID=1633489 RepID=A0A1D8R9V3_9TELE|nr:ATP synthase subunit 8 [Uranoscopus tosae]